MYARSDLEYSKWNKQTMQSANYAPARQLKYKNEYTETNICLFVLCFYALVGILLYTKTIIQTHTGIE